MTQLSKDGGDLIGVEAALAAVQKLCRPVTEVEAVALSAGLGRILAADVTAPRDVPPTDNSAVDGYALYFDDLNEKAETTLPVTGRAAAGHPLDRPAQRGEAVRIFTGAAMPTGAAGEPGPDTVAMQEDCKAISGAKGAEVVVLPGLKRGGNARHKGEDVAAGSVVLTAGQRLRPQDLGLAASVGLRQLDVFAPLKVAIFSTGDEICDPGGELPPGGIYDANRTCIMALLQGLGCEITDLGILADDPAPLAEALGRAADGHDLVLTSGGVSVGEEDHVRAAVQAQGGLAFWRLAIKPGRPVAMGEIGATPFIGLPGNPAAMMVTFLRIARPAILALGGAKVLAPPLYRVASGFDHKKKAGRREYVRARLTQDQPGPPVARKFERAGAGILTSFVEADGLVELPEDLVQLKSGDNVDFLPFSEVM